MGYLTRLPRSLLLCVIAVLVAPPTAGAQSEAAAPWDSVSRILRVPPAPASGFHRFNFPRRDLAVRVGRVLVNPALALTGWAGFAGGPESSMVMGDLVVLPSELSAVVRGLVSRGFEVSAIHNHLAGEKPAVLYVHFDGHGAATSLARQLDTILSATAAPRSVTAPAAVPLAIDTALVFRELGVRGRANGRVAGVGPVLLAEPLVMGSDSIPRTLAAASPINLQMLAGGRAATSGDFAVRSDRVAPLIRALTEAGITPTAVHSHLVGERPTVTYIHFWGVGPLAQLLRGLRTALDSAR